MIDSDDGDLRRAAAARIAAKYAERLRERSRIKDEQARLAEAERENEREIAECKAAARFFGYVIEPQLSERLLDARKDHARIMRERAALARSRGDFANAEAWEERARSLESRVHEAEAEIEQYSRQGLLPLPIVLAEESLTANQFGAVAGGTISSTGKAPRIRDVALDQLRLAGAAGMKAKPIQIYIENTYAMKLHDKTVGMTLYRLSTENLVHRKGQTWFYGPQEELSLPASTENPGAVTPGHTHEAD